MRRWPFALAFALSLAGCASNSYYYQPAEQSNATVAGRPAARYVIPPGIDQGDVRVSTFGVTDVRLSEDDEPVRSLHVRLVVANESGARDWTIDTRMIQVQYGGIADSRAPSFANTTGAGMPVVVVPPGESRTIDLFYPLPAELEGAQDIPQFDVVWQVQTDDRLVAERTPFERRRIEPLPPAGAYGWGVGAYPYWWYDPFWYGGYYGRPLVTPRAVPPPRVFYYGHPRR
jgi:hypothetical protein